MESSPVCRHRPVVCTDLALQQFLSVSRQIIKQLRDGGCGFDCATMQELDFLRLCSHHPASMRLGRRENEPCEIAKAGHGHAPCRELRRGVIEALPRYYGTRIKNS